MKWLFKIYLLFFVSFSFAQLPGIKVGDKAPSFVLTMQQNSTMGFSMPYMSRIVLLHFYSTSVSKSTFYNKPFNRLAKRYKDAMYRGAEGFEAVAVAVQSDKSAWMEGVKNDTLNQLINGIAVRGYNDDICKKYGINSLPTDILIDENGIVIGINPKITVVEDVLDSKKNFMPVKKDAVGTIALSSNSSDFYKYAKVYLFNAYGDSLGRTITDDKGAFVFSDVKLNQDFVLKVDNGADIVVSDPIAIFNAKGERIIESKTAEGGFIFYIPSNLSHKLVSSDEDAALEGKIDQVDVTKHLSFKNAGAELTPKDEFEMKSIVEILSKNRTLSIEITGHSSTKLDAKLAQANSLKQAATVKNYLVKKGVAANRIKTFSKGNSEPLNDCRPPQHCSEEDHIKNQRIQFRIYKD